MKKRESLELKELRDRVIKLEKELRSSPVKMIPSASLASFPFSNGTAFLPPMTRTCSAPNVFAKHIVQSEYAIPMQQIDPVRVLEPQPSSTSKFSPVKDGSQIKLALDPGGKMIATACIHNPLYDIIDGIHRKIMLSDDQQMMLRRMVDSKVHVAIKTIQELEHENEVPKLKQRLLELFQEKSPTKLNALSGNLVVHSMEGVPFALQKIEHMLKQFEDGMEVAVLVASGAYNPVHMQHVRAFYVARQYVESTTNFPVVGGFISPAHNTYVRTKNRRTPAQMIPSRHRLGMLEQATLTSSWVEVDKWEITRRRVLDYLSVLGHVREMCEANFPKFKFRVMYVCGCNTILKLNHAALRDEKFQCIVVCRPSQMQQIKRYMGAKWTKIAFVAEDVNVLSCELEAATSMRVRNVMIANGPVGGMVGKHVANYIKQHEIDAKIAGKAKWTPIDRSWREVDMPFVEYQ